MARMAVTVIGAAFGLEGGGGLPDDRPQLPQHFGNDMIRPDQRRRSERP